VFGEASYDVTPQLTLTAGGRWYKYDNTLIGFFGFGRNPAFFQNAPNNPPVNPANSTKTGVAACFTQSGDTLRNSQINGTDTVLLPPVVPGSPCTNLADFVDGKLVPKRTEDSGFIHRLNAQWKPQENLMFYATWSRGFRPGGINRRADVGPYAADFLTNYEIGWKTSWGPLRWNGAIYHETWKKFQFAFLGANSFTEIHNGKDARVNGIETDLNYVHGGWTVTAAGAYTDAKTKGNICSDASDTTPDCSNSFIAAPTGTRLPVTPKFKGTLTTRYSWQAWSDVKAHVQGALSYQSSAPSSIRTEFALVGTGEHVNPNDFQGFIGAAALVDLYAGIDWRDWNIELYGTNIFDKRNDISRFTACGSCMRALVVPGRPRTIGLRVGTKF
jgi:outer membrane receptor protein involved in Fe transport